MEAVKLQDVGLETLGSGGAVEQFNRVWGEVVASILDPNTDPEAAREITLKVTVKPSLSRADAQVEIKVSSKLPGPRPVSVPVWFGTREGKPIAVARDLRQREMFGGDDDSVVPVKPTIPLNPQSLRVAP